MKMRRLNILLVLWVILLTGPATLVLLGGFGHVDAHKSISGGLSLAWILGYLAQLGIFMWIMSMIDQSVLWRTLVWWFSACLLPWALDWTPASPLLLLWYTVAIALAFWIALVARGAQSFEQHAVRATGTVLEVLKPWMNVVINN